MSAFLFLLTPGIPIRTTLDNATTVQYAGLVHQLTGKARTTVRDLDPTNDLSFLRLRTTKNEIMIAPGRLGVQATVICRTLLSANHSLADKDYLLIVIQDPTNT